MNAAEHFLHRLQASWHEPFFQTLTDDVFTYGDTWETARQLSRGWQEDGLPPGSVIALRASNAYALPCFYLACLQGGYVACPVVPSLGEETVQLNMATVEPALQLDSLNLKPVRANTTPTVSELEDTGRPFLIMFSSGSTGRNKAICHAFDNVAGSARAFAELSGFNADTRLYHVLPMTYMAGFLNAMLAVMMAGGRVIEGPQFSMETVADFWHRPLATSANTLSTIPPLAAAVCRLTRDPAKIRQVSQQFNLVQCTSQAIQADLRQRFLDKFQLPLRDCYGMTELGGPLSIQSEADALAMNDFSQPLPALDIEIRDGGALWIRSPWTMLGYLNLDGRDDGSLTRPVDDGGFLDTGDLATLEQGRLMITGREKDIVIKGGINTSPARIESIMSQLPVIEEIAVIGLPHPFWGEELVACVVASQEDTPGILAWCREHLDSHEIPDRIEYLPEFPRSFIGKVLKRHLVEQLSRG